MTKHLSLFPRDNFNSAVADFLNYKDEFILFNVVMAAADALEGTESELRNIDHSLLAASYIHCICSNIKQTEENPQINIEADDIVKFFRINGDKVEKQSLDLKRELNQKKFDLVKAFKEEAIAHMELLAESEEEFNRIEIFELKYNISETNISSARKDIESKLAKFSQEVEIHSITQDGDLMFIVLSATEEIADLLIEDLGLFGSTFALRCIYDYQNPYTPDSTTAFNLSNVEELSSGETDFLAKIDASTDFMPEELKDESFERKLKTSKLYTSLYLMNREDSLAHVKMILAENPSNLELYIIKAGWEFDGKRKLEILEEALEIGDKLFSKGRLQDYGPWWLDERTRPYMRMKFHYAAELKWYEYIDDSISELWFLLNLDKSDPLEVRYILAQTFLHEKDMLSYQKVRSRYKNDGFITFMIGDVIYNYRKHKICSKTRKSIVRLLHEQAEYVGFLSGILEFNDLEDPVLLHHVEMMISFFNSNKKFASHFMKIVAEHQDDLENLLDLDFPY